jgi:putative transposase
MFTAQIRRKRVDRMRSLPHWRWHLDEVFVTINDVTHFLWRAIDHEGEVLEALVTKRRDRKAALKFLRETMKRHGLMHACATDKLRCYGAAMKDNGDSDKQDSIHRKNNRAENSHLSFRWRERAMHRFRRMQTFQKFASVHASAHNHFNQERRLSNLQAVKDRRIAPCTEPRDPCAAKGQPPGAG